VFVGYLMSGIFFIAALAGKLFLLASTTKNIGLAEVKKVCAGANLYDIIVSTHRKLEASILKQESGEISLTDMCTGFIPTQDKPSKIATSEETVKFMQKNALFELIPKVHLYANMKQVFSFYNNGLLIEDLNRNWRKAKKASLLLIQSPKWIYGVFFDRELEMIENGVNNTLSCIFILDNRQKVYKHNENKEICYRFAAKTGIMIGEKE
jgi:hypothetical protein